MVMAIPITGVATVKITTYPAPNRPPVSSLRSRIYALPVPLKSAMVTIGGPVGLHARPAADFVRSAERFRSEIRVVKDGRRVNGKSILALLTLAAERGSVVQLEVEGSDEAEALATLKEKLEVNDS